MLQRIHGAVEHRLGKFDLGHHIGQVVFDGLEGANGFAKLRALGGVVYRDIKHALGQADQLASYAQRAALLGLVPQGLAVSARNDQSGRAGRPLHSAQAARGVDAAVLRHMHRVARHGVQFRALRCGVGEQQQIGQVCVGHQRVDWVAQRNAATAVRNAGQPGAAQGVARAQGAQQAGGEVGGIGQRIGDGEVTQLLRHQRPSDIAHAQAAFGFGHGQRGKALGGDFAAHLG